MTQLPPQSCVVYTPVELAAALVTALSRKNADEWLEPSCGDGAFLRALAARGVTSDRIRGIDIQPRKSTSDVLARVRRGVDFLAWGRTTRERFDCVAGNPPYVRLSALPPHLRKSALLAVGDHGLRVTAGANLWLAFVATSLHLLRPGGNLGLVLPAAFEYADYAECLRQSLPTMFHRVAVYRSERPLFTEVKDGSVVLVAKGFGQSCSEIERHEYPDLSGLVGDLCRSGRPSPASQAGASVAEPRSVPTVALKQIISLRIGAVTGDVNYFLLTDAQRRSRGLSVSACRPVLSKTAHLIAPIITEATWRKLRESGQRVWLFRPTTRQSRTGRVRTYLRNAGATRKAYKVRGRSPWYRTAMPTRADAFLSGQWQNGPWLSISGMARLSATNTLYLATFASKNMSLDEKAAWGLSLMSSHAFASWKRHCRKYADGLIKCEPSDLAEVRLPIPPERCTGAMMVYRRAVGLMLDGRSSDARALADQWLDGTFATKTNAVGGSRAELASTG